MIKERSEKLKKRRKAQRRMDERDGQNEGCSRQGVHGASGERKMRRH